MDLQKIIDNLDVLILNNEDDLDRGKGKYIIRSYIEELEKELVKSNSVLGGVSESLLADMDLELRQSKQELPEIAKGAGECYYGVGWKKSQEHFQMLLNNSR